MSWTPDRKDTLRQMWIEGKTSRQIAETLGGVTRNAVMGMVNRMGLMGNQAHNSVMRTVRGACRPIVRTDMPDENLVDGVAELPQPAFTADVAVLPEPGPEAILLEDAPRAEDASEPVMADQPEPAAAAPAGTAEPDRQKADAEPGPKAAANDDPAPDKAEGGGSRLARRLLGPIRRMVSPDRPQTPAIPVAQKGFVAETGDAARPRRPDARTAVSMVQEIMGNPYDAASPVHRTALVAISSILAGGDPRPMLPRGFPEPVVIRTLRNLAEKGIMIAGRTPDAWLDPELGDLNFFIDVLRAEGVLRTPRSPRTLTA